MALFVLKPVLLRGQIAEAAHRPFLVEIGYVALHRSRDVAARAHGEIDEHLRLGPAVYGLHRPVVGRSPGTGHAPCDTIWLKDVVVCLRGVHRALIRVEYGLKAHVLLFFVREELRQSLEIGGYVSLPRRQRPSDDLVVPEVHVEGELPVSAGRPEGGHVAHDDLIRAVHVEGCEHHVRIGSPWLPRLPVTVMVALGGYAEVPAASPRVFVAHDDPEIQPYLGVEPSVAVARVLAVIGEEEGDVAGFFVRFVGRVDVPMHPFVVPAPVDRHLVAGR